MGLERELKFEVEDFTIVRERIKKMGGILEGRYFEKNIVLDTPEKGLIAEGKLLRLRRAAGKNLLCFKRPSPSQEEVKTFIEYEIETSNFKDTIHLFRELGYMPIGEYEKIREKWRINEVKICLDVLPFGKFVEIESNGDILSLAERLGLCREKAMKETYHELNKKKRKSLGLPLEDSFVFGKWRKAT